MRLSEDEKRVLKIVKSLRFADEAKIANVMDSQLSLVNKVCDSLMQARLLKEVAGDIMTTTEGSRMAATIRPGEIEGLPEEGEEL